jgi:hypothetical protein
LQHVNIITYWLLISYEDYYQHNEKNGIKIWSNKEKMCIFIVMINSFIVNPPFKNDGGGSYSGGDFINPHHEFWKIDQKVFTIKIFFVYLYWTKWRETVQQIFLFNIVN